MSSPLGPHKLHHLLLETQKESTRRPSFQLTKGSHMAAMGRAVRERKRKSENHGNHSLRMLEVGGDWVTVPGSVPPAPSLPGRVWSHGGAACRD